MRPLRALMAGLIDYAGLFPPAGLALPEVAAAYADYLAGPGAWALGRLIVPAARLGELAVLHHAPCTMQGRPRPDARSDPGRRPDGGAQPGSPWRVSALVGADVGADLAAIEGWLGRGTRGTDATGRPPALLVDTVELRAESAEAIRGLAEGLPAGVTAYVEIPLGPDPRPLAAALAGAGLRAKVRTGGVTQDAFPGAPALARFLAACVAAGVPFKATAGLHHPLCGSYPLTYAPDSPRAPMYGFLNLLLATAALMAPSDADEQTVVAILEERDPAAIHIDESGAAWRGLRWGAAELALMRRAGMAAFGSCSFREPVEELGLLLGSPLLGR